RTTCKALRPQIVRAFGIDFVLRAIRDCLLPRVCRFQVEVFANQGGPSALCVRCIYQVREHLREIVLEVTLEKIPQACAHAGGHPVSMDIAPGELSLVLANASNYRPCAHCDFLPGT